METLMLTAKPISHTSVHEISQVASPVKRVAKMTLDIVHTSRGTREAELAIRDCRQHASGTGSQIGPQAGSSAESDARKGNDDSHIDSSDAARMVLSLSGATTLTQLEERLHAVASKRKASETVSSGFTAPQKIAPTTNVSKPTGRSALRKQSPGERLQRSRERNRMHARKTRQRKKEHMKNLQDRVEELKTEQLRLRQVINEKNTASILVGLFATVDARCSGPEDPEIEKLLLRPVSDIPDASKIPELPALILPGHHNSKRGKAAAAAAMEAAAVKASMESDKEIDAQSKLPDDGIDYELLGKDRSKCTPAELDQIRRERNRMHAKRTRDRKRLFMDEMEHMIQVLEGENKSLKDHLDSMDGNHVTVSAASEKQPNIVSPKFAPSTEPSSSKATVAPANATSSRTSDPLFSDQIKTILGPGSQSCMELLSSAASAISASTDVSANSSDLDEPTACSGLPSKKRQRTDQQDSAPVPNSIEV